MLKCEICGGGLVCERIDDGIIKYLIDPKTNFVEELINKSNGSTRVYCSNSAEHKLSLDLINKVQDLVE